MLCLQSHKILAVVLQTNPNALLLHCQNRFALSFQDVERIKLKKIILAQSQIGKIGIINYDKMQDLDSALKCACMFVKVGRVKAYAHASFTRNDSVCPSQR